MNTAYQALVDRLETMSMEELQRSLQYWINQDEQALRMFPNARGCADEIGAVRIFIEREQNRKQVLDTETKV